MVLTSPDRPLTAHVDDVAVDGDASAHLEELIVGELPAWETGPSPRYPLTSNSSGLIYGSPAPSISGAFAGSRTC